MRLSMATAYLLSRWTRKNQFKREASDIYQLYRCLQLEKEVSADSTLGWNWNYRVYYKRWKEVHAAVTEQLKEKLQWLDRPTIVGKDSAAAVQDVAGYQLEVGEEKQSRNKKNDFDDEDVEDMTEQSRGVKLKGSTSAGSILCCYPGTVYLSQHVQNMPNFPDISDGNPFLMARMDEAVIDAFEYGTEENLWQGLAVGHHIRHPPKGAEANVMPFTYDFPRHFPDHLLRIVPNNYYKKPGFPFNIPAPKCSTVLFITKRKMENEELFLNYRLHPDSQIPSWYEAVDEREDSERWKE